MIILAEKNKLVRKYIIFDLSDSDQKLAYDILESKRGKILRRFLAKSIIIGEMIEIKMKTNEIEKRGNQLLSNIENFSIDTDTVSTPLIKEKRKSKQKEVAEEIINPVIAGTEEIQTFEPENMVQDEPSAKEMEVEEDNESTDTSLDDDIFKKAMNFFGNF